MGTVGRKVKTKVEVRDRDGQPIKGRTCTVAGRRRCAEHGSARPRSGRGSHPSQSRRSIEDRHCPTGKVGHGNKQTSARPRLALPEGKPGRDEPEQRPEKAGAAWPKSGPRRRRPRDPHRGVSSAGAKTLAFFRSGRDAKSWEARAGEHATGKTCSKRALSGRHLQSSGLQSRLHIRRRTNSRSESGPNSVLHVPLLHARILVLQLELGSQRTGRARCSAPGLGIEAARERDRPRGPGGRESRLGSRQSAARARCSALEHALLMHARILVLQLELGSQRTGRARCSAPGLGIEAARERDRPRGPGGRESRLGSRQSAARARCSALEHALLMHARILVLQLELGSQRTGRARCSAPGLGIEAARERDRPRGPGGRESRLGSRQSAARARCSALEHALLMHARILVLQLELGSQRTGRARCSAPGLGIEAARERDRPRGPGGRESRLGSRQSAARARCSALEHALLMHARILVLQLELGSQRTGRARCSAPGLGIEAARERDRPRGPGGRESRLGSRQSAARARCSALEPILRKCYFCKTYLIYVRQHL